MNFDRGTSAAMAHTIDSGEERMRSRRNTGSSYTSSDRPSRLNKAKLGTSDKSEFSLQALALLALTPMARSLYRWWLQRAERHYLICADVEEQRAREAQMNVAYYQKRAALARSARI